MNSVSFLILVAALFILVGLRNKFRRKKRSKRRRSWSFFKSKTKKRSDSWYEKAAWKKIRDRRREQNNRDNGLSKTRTGALLLKCDRCGIVGTGHQIDHIHPRQKFPHLALRYSNTQTLCSVKSKPKAPGCNQKKSDKTDGHNWRRIRSLPGGAVIAFVLRRKQVKEGRR